MGKKQGTILALIFVVVLACVVIWNSQSNDGPEYKGKSLREWAEQLKTQTDNNSGIIYGPIVGYKDANELEAEEAIRQIGTNGIPFLVEELGSSHLSYE